MNADRFKDFDSEVREFVLAFEKQRGEGSQFFDVEQMEIIIDYYLDVHDVEGLAAAVEYGQRLYPANDEILLRKAHLMCIQGEYQQALDLLKELEARNTDNTDISYALGVVYDLMDKPRESIEYYQKASADGYQLDMIYGNIGDEYYKLGMSEDAVEYYKRSVGVNPEEERSHYNLICTWNEQGRYKEAEEFYSRFVEEHPFCKSAWCSLGSIYNWLSLYEKGADAFEYALAIDPTFYSAHVGLSSCYRSMGETGKAVQALRDALNYADDRPMILHTMGQVYMEAGNRHAAMTYFRHAVKEDPAYSEAWGDLGKCCQELGYHDEAAGYYRRAIDLDPDVDDHWISLADLYILTEKNAEAAALLESARAEASDRFQFDSRLAYCYFKLGRRNRLFSLLQQDARDYAPLYPSLLANYPEMAQDPEVAHFCISQS